MPAHDKKRIKPVIEEVAPEAVEPVETKPTTLETQPETPESAAVTETESVEEAPKKEAKKMNLKLIIVITLVSALVAAFVSGGVYVYLSGAESTAPTPQEEETEEVEATPEPSPSPTPEAVDISTYSVQVLNGSGAIGVASAAEDVLVDAGFTVDDTGNAGRYDYKGTLVQAKQGVSGGAISQLKEALEAEDYSVEVGDKLPTSSEFDIVVTVGKN